MTTFDIDLLPENNVFDISLSADCSFDLEVGYGVGVDKYPQYRGEYTATPKVIDQTFETKKTSMEHDFVVSKITYLETPNIGNGLTATIGEL